MKRPMPGPRIIAVPDAIEEGLGRATVPIVEGEIWVGIVGKTIRQVQGLREIVELGDGCQVATSRQVHRVIAVPGSMAVEDSVREG